LNDGIINESVIRGDKPINPSVFSFEQVSMSLDTLEEEASYFINSGAETETKYLTMIENSIVQLYHSTAIYSLEISAND
jgi:hypothetical protein